MVEFYVIDYLDLTHLGRRSTPWVRKPQLSYKMLFTRWALFTISRKTYITCMSPLTCHMSPPTHASLVTHAIVAHHPGILQFMADGSAKSAVLMSGKPGCFIAGADIRVSGTLLFDNTCFLRTYFLAQCWTKVWYLFSAPIWASGIRWDKSVI